jgi:AraC family transcriptional regulator of adaptative response/methylated-DNA-[protein]-cysteine methyltransferase
MNAMPQTAQILNSAAQWNAVLARDRGADGLFVYAVSSTGIYCRPSCPSRKPRRDRVAFFDTTDAARRAGFRACRRCHPDASVVADPGWTRSGAPASI